MHQMTTRARARKLAIRSMLTVGAVAALVASGASASEAKARKHWRNANAAVATSGSFSGKASYYGSESGARTASGARYNPMGMTAAHRSLPFGTKLKVTHGSRSVVVTVNDRGPFIRGRVLDLSKGAAQVIGLTGRGVGHVVAEVQ
jgi:rare lipoprotein A